jgi:hypothetical protein
MISSHLPPRTPNRASPNATNDDSSRISTSDGSTMINVLIRKCSTRDCCQAWT